MGEYSEECVLAFLKNQGQLYDEPVAETYEEAEEFLEDCMAVVVQSVKEVCFSAMSFGKITVLPSRTRFNQFSFS